MDTEDNPYLSRALKVWEAVHFRDDDLEPMINATRFHDLLAEENGSDQWPDSAFFEVPLADSDQACPFCNGTELNFYPFAVNGPPFRANFFCDNCGAEGPFADGATREEASANALAAWNKRPTPAVSEDLSSWHILDAELAAIYGEMGAINETVRKEQTPAQKDRLNILRAECVVICSKRYALLNQRKTV